MGERETGGKGGVVSVTMRKKKSYIIATKFPYGNFVARFLAFYETKRACYKVATKF
jgi:hypothetical protein